MTDEYASILTSDPVDPEPAQGGWRGPPAVTDEIVLADRDEPADAELEPAEQAAAPTAAIGRVASPVRFESTSSRWYFWAAPGALVEKTQLVWTSSEIAARSIRFFGTVSEVFRRSRKRSIDDEIDTYGGDLE